MSTSIEDLLTVLDLESRRSRPIDPRDAGLALHWYGRLLNRLRDDWPESDEARARDAVLRRLADACTQASIAFDTGAGRLSNLAGAVSDAATRPGNGLNRDDRWAVAIRAATPTRRLAAAIAASGPYADVPQLLTVTDRSRELLRTAAAAPPEPTNLSGLDKPITSTLSAAGHTPAARIVEATARLAAEFCRCSRDPMTVRELVAVCHATSLLAEYVEETITGEAESRSASGA